METGKIGTRIKNYRENKGMSLEQLAAKTALDAGFIEAIERGDASPALGPMVKISRALGVRLGTFTDDELSHDPCITRAAERKAESSVQASGEKSMQMSYYHLGQGKADRHMEPFQITLEPAGDSPEMSAHEGEEFIVVISGEVILRYGKEEHILGPGDTLYYNSIVPHHIGAHGDSTADIYAVIYVPF